MRLLLAVSLVVLVGIVYCHSLDTECGTQTLWEMKLEKYGRQALRNPEFKPIPCGNGPCDDPLIRDASPQGDLYVNIAYHLMNSDSGESPSGLTLDDINRLISRSKAAYEPYGISFNVQGIYSHNNSAYYCIPAYSGGIFPEWSRAIDAMKEEYAVSPETTLNVFISCQTSGASGTLNGIATFPWDRSALTALGGLWINSIIATPQEQSANNPVLIHELGHNFGLWHTFHGWDEVPSCSECTENVHVYDAPEADYVGDLCADTDATPKNYDCAPPPGADCNNDIWGFTDFNNLMGYSRYPSNCRSTFSDKQEKRMHCWLCDALAGQIYSGC